MDSPRNPASCRRPDRIGADARLMGWIAAAGILTGACVGLALGARLGIEYLGIGALKGATLGGLVSLIVGGLEQIGLRPLWRRMALGRAILLRTVVYAPLTLGIYLAVSAMFSPWLSWNLQRSNLLPALAVALGSMLFWSAVIGLGRLVSFRVLRNLISGRYHSPFEEDRIFLFLDLVGSTAIAERIGHLRYHAFLRDFIEDLEAPVFAHGGDIYQYVGDEVVVTWPLADPRSNGRCLACHFAIVDAIELARSRYQRAFGTVPTFRTGIHCGRVVAGEIGDQRKQIVFVGDVVNTASRAQAQAKEREMDLVVTGELLAQTYLAPGIEARPLGVVRPKGKEQAIELFEVVRHMEAVVCP